MSDLSVYDLRRLLVGDQTHRPGIGDVFHVRGLLDRAKGVVESYQDYAKDLEPTTGSIIRFGASLGHDLDDRDPLELAVILVEFNGKNALGSTNQDAVRGYISYLTRERLSDVEILLGSQRVGTGLLKRAKDRARGLLDKDPPPEPDVTRCYDLALWLRDWLGQKCTHSFEDGKCSKCEALLEVS